MGRVLRIAFAAAVIAAIAIILISPSFVDDVDGALHQTHVQALRLVILQLEDPADATVRFLSSTLTIPKVGLPLNILCVRLC